MDHDDELRFEFPGVFRLYKSGRIDRLIGTTFVPTSVDPATGISTKDVTIDAKTQTSARLYLPTPTDKKLPILVYFHGGAFCVESAFSPTYVPFLTSIASRANLLVVSVNYRMAPEHLLPAAYEDSWTALSWVVSPHADDTWLREHGDVTRVFLAGESAGANIAHRMAMRAADAGLGVERMVLVHPYFWGREPVGAETRVKEEREWMEELWRVVNLPGVDLDDPTMNPMAAPGLDRLGRCGMKKVMVCVAERDWLCERGRAYGKALEGSGWGGEEVVVVESPGEEHAFHLQKPGCKEALELVDKVVDFLASD